MASLLDTNIVSQRMKLVPDPKVMRWLEQVNAEDTFLSVVSLQEIRYGIELLKGDSKRQALERWVTQTVLPAYAGRILPITAEIADVCGQLMARGKASGKLLEMGDAYIAATAIVHGMTIATLNRKHFEKLSVDLVEF